jgi:hypothetical protein
MKRNKLFILIAGGTLMLSMLACNVGRSPDPFVPVPPTVEQGWTQSAQETAAATAAPAGVVSGACVNPYMPIITGASWSYKLTGPVSDTFTRSITSVEADSFADQEVFGTGVTRQSKWNCDNGNLVALNPADGGSSTINTEDYSVDFQTTALSGETLPATVNAGDTWEQTMTLEGTQTINETTIPTKNEFSNTCKSIGIESVTVEAGTFDAMKVECLTVMDLTITMNDNPIQQNLTLNNVNWYAETIGLVKSTTTGGGLDSIVELTAYSIP